MGFYLRKSVRVGPLRFNLSGSGVGVSAGIRGFRVGTGPRGNYVHVGSHGLYYRASLGPTATPRQMRPPSAQEPPARTIAGLPEIESGSVQDMAPASALELLEEIRTKRGRTTLWPLHALLGAFGLLALAISGLAPKWTLGVGLVILAASTAWVRAHDLLRRTVVLLYDLDGPIVEAYQGLHNGFDWLAKSAAVWHLEAQGRTLDQKHQAGATYLVKRRSVRLVKGDPSGIKTNVEVPLLPVGRQALFLLPDRVLIVEGNAVGAVEYSELEAHADTSVFIETEGVPSDSQVVGQTWRYVNKNGGPDRRFNDNRQIPKVLYGELRLRSASGLNEALQTSNKDAPSQFAAGLATLAHALSAGPPSTPAPAQESDPEAPSPRDETEPGIDRSARTGQWLFLSVLVTIPAALVIAGTLALSSAQSARVVTAPVTAAPAAAPSPMPNPNLRKPGRGSGNPSHDALLSRGPAQRTAALSQMVKKSGQACTGTRNYFQRLDAPSRDATWNVACNNGKAYAVTLTSKAGSSAKVVDCATLKLANECFKK